MGTPGIPLMFAQGPSPADFDGALVKCDFLHGAKVMLPGSDPEGHFIFSPFPVEYGI
jgi:hypothetical protein